MNVKSNFCVKCNKHNTDIMTYKREEQQNTPPFSYVNLTDFGLLPSEQISS